MTDDELELVRCYREWLQFRDQRTANDLRIAAERVWHGYGPILAGGGQMVGLA